MCIRSQTIQAERQLSSRHRRDDTRLLGAHNNRIAVRSILFGKVRAMIHLCGTECERIKDCGTDWWDLDRWSSVTFKAVCSCLHRIHCEVSWRLFSQSVRLQTVLIGQQMHLQTVERATNKIILCILLPNVSAYKRIVRVDKSSGSDIFVWIVQEQDIYFYCNQEWTQFLKTGLVNTKIIIIDAVYSKPRRTIQNAWYITIVSPEVCCYCCQYQHSHISLEWGYREVKRLYRKKTGSS